MGLLYGVHDIRMGAVLMHSISLQSFAQPTSAAMVRRNRGMEIRGRTFVTMVLVRNESGLSGSVTGSRHRIER
ncbi:MAG: hypothetical protein QM775_32445 [Pirellulales bacterium]